MTDNTILGRKSRKWNKIRRHWYKFSRNSLSVLGLTIILIVVFLAVFSPYIVPSPESIGNYINFAEASQSPSLNHICGTDIFGRDIFSRILFGSRLSLLMGITVLAISVPIGVIAGLIAGYYRGSWVSVVIMRTIDIFVAVPALLLALVVCSILTPGIFNAMMAITFCWWAWYGRIVYGVVSSIKGEFYIQAAEIAGASTGHILFKEILPNCLPPIFTKISLDMGFVIILGSTISFVGLGAQPPTPDLGTMLAEGSKYLPDQWWISCFPALAIVIIVLAFNLTGDGISDTFGKERG